MEKTLIVYYSKSGNTKCVAQRISEMVRGDLHEVNMKKSNTSDLGDMLRLWLDPVLPFENVSDGQLIKLYDYDHVYIGTPVWGLTYALPIKEFIQANDFTDMKVSLFATHDGGLGNTLKAMSKKITNGQVVKVLDILSCDCRNEDVLNQHLSNWMMA